MIRTWRTSTASALALATALAGASLPMASAATGASAAVDPQRTCRVANVTRGTADSSLRRVIRAARDGDRLTLRGTCAGALIDKDLTIRGFGDDPTISGFGRNRVLRIPTSAAVTLRRLVIERGVTSGRRGYGAGIRNHGQLTIMGARVRRNEARGPGGGIYNVGSLLLIDTVVARNSTRMSGGAIQNFGSLSLIRSWIVDNTSRGAGGGIHSAADTTTHLHQSRVVNNVALSAGGIANMDELTLNDSIVARNVARGSQRPGRIGEGGRGGGIHNLGVDGEVSLIRSRVTRNRASEEGGGLYNVPGGDSITLDPDSSVTGNAPDDCSGTTAC